MSNASISFFLNQTHSIHLFKHENNVYSDVFSIHIFLVGCLSVPKNSLMFIILDSLNLHVPAIIKKLINYDAQ
jgi:hypothetical protein